MSTPDYLMSGVCRACQHQLQIGEWPFCPHGFAQGVGIIDDQIEGGPRLFDTMGPDDVWIESKSQWRREVEARGLVNVDKYDRAHYVKKFREHDERLRDLGQK